jgi:hypothetical protein
MPECKNIQYRSFVRIVWRNKKSYLRKKSLGGVLNWGKTHASAIKKLQENVRASGKHISVFGGVRETQKLLRFEISVQGC